MADKTPPRVAAPIRERMARNGVRQVDLAKHLGQRQNWVSKRLTGEVKIRYEEVESIAAFLGTTVKELLDDEAAESTEAVA